MISYASHVGLKRVREVVVMQMMVLIMQWMLMVMVGEAGGELMVKLGLLSY